MRIRTLTVVAALTCVLPACAAPQAASEPTSAEQTAPNDGPVTFAFVIRQDGAVVSEPNITSRPDMPMMLEGDYVGGPVKFDLQFTTTPKGPQMTGSWTEGALAPVLLPYGEQKALLKNKRRKLEVMVTATPHES